MYSLSLLLALAVPHPGRSVELTGEWTLSWHNDILIELRKDGSYWEKGEWKGCWRRVGRRSIEVDQFNTHDNFLTIRWKATFNSKMEGVVRCEDFLGTKWSLKIKLKR